MIHRSRQDLAKGILPIFVLTFVFLGTQISEGQTNPKWHDRYTFVSESIIWSRSLTGDLTALGYGGNAVWSPDGTKLAYFDWTRSPTALRVVNADGSNNRILTSIGNESAGISWFPGNTRLAFTGGGIQDQSDIYAINADGTGLLNLTNTPAINEYGPSVAPNGTKIVYGRDDADGSGTFIMNPEGSGQTAIMPPFQNSIGFGGAVWSPDGNKLLRVCPERDQDPQINYVHLSVCVTGSGGGTPTKISSDTQFTRDENFITSEYIYGLSWSNDSSKVLFVKQNQTYDRSTFEQTRYQSIYTASLGGGETLVEGFGTVRASQIPAPAFSPDDSMIVAADTSTNTILVLKEGGRIPFPELPTIWLNALSWQPREPCDCDAIARPANRDIESDWQPVNGFDINWRLSAEVSDTDGLVLKDVRLGDRYLARRLSVPYVNVQTSTLPLTRLELTPDGSPPVGRSRLAKYEVTADGEKLVIEATYVLDRVPNGSNSCVHVIQRYEFYRQGFGGKCEPSEGLYCSVWRPTVSYKYFAAGNSLTSITIPQRREIAVDDQANTVSIFKDCDSPGLQCAVFESEEYDVAFARKKNPLLDEISDRVVSEGQSTGLWDNIHQTSNPKIVDEPSFCPLCVPTGGYLIEPGCPECMHSHWRWASYFGEPFGSGLILDIPKGSRQDLDVAIVRTKVGEEDPLDFRSTFNNEPIRFLAEPEPTNRPRPEMTLPDFTVTWYVGTGKQNSDEFFRFAGFYSSSKKTYKIWDSLLNLTALSLDDELASVTANDFYHDGETTVTGFDVSALDQDHFDPIPAGYSIYNDLSRDVQTESESSGPYIATFTVPSVTDPAVFDELRILHAEQDPFDPERAIWVDRTILAPDQGAPDFATRTVSSRSTRLGPFILARFTAPPPITGSADLALIGSHSPGQVSAGEELSFSFTVANNGPQLATNVRSVSSVPAGSRFVNTSSSQGSCKESEGTIACKLGDIPASSTATVSFALKPSPRGMGVPPASKTISSSSFVRGDQVDPNYLDNTVVEQAIVTASANVAPAVNLLTPTDGTTVVGSGTSVALSASASDTDGTIAKVEFFDGGQLIGTVTTPTNGKYELQHSGFGFGAHSVFAIATDNGGETSISNSSNIFINGSASVAITSPLSSAQYQSPATISVNISASTSGGTIAEVAVYANGLPVGTASESGAGQYAFTWSGVDSGTYNLTAYATDGAGLVTRSAIVPVTVALIANFAPQTSLYSPSNGSIYVAPANVDLIANATDTDGTISQVNFFANSTFIGIGTPIGNNQYRFSWTNLPKGSYSFYAVATDNKGATTTTSSRSFSVRTQALFVVGSTALTASDSLIRSRLESLGYVVTVKDGSSALTADAAGKSIVVISSTVTPSTVGTKFRDVMVPVLLWESGLFPNMGMTGIGNKDYGTAARQTQIQITTPAHPLAAGLSGTITIYAPRETISWGKPNANSAKIASVVGDATKVTVFAYTTGSGMFGLNAPSKRVGFFAFDATVINFTTNGWTLFDSAVNWATQ